MVRTSLAVSLAVVAVSLAALAGADEGARYRPYLYVSGFAGSEVRFEIRRSVADLATYTADIRVPHQYGARLNQPLGAVVGRVAAVAVARGASPPYAGTLTVARPDPNNGCFSVADNDTAWNVSLSNGARSFNYQLYVRRHRDVTLLWYCLPPDAGVLVSMTYTVTGVFSEPRRGNYAWRGQFYPYNAAGEVVDNDAGVGTAAVVRLPHLVTLKATSSKQTHRYFLHGSVKEGGVGVAHASVLLLVGAKGALHPLARVTTSANGSFSYSGRLSATKSLQFRAAAHVGGRRITPAHCSAINGWPCVSKTVSAWGKNSRIARGGPRASLFSSFTEIRGVPATP